VIVMAVCAVAGFAGRSVAGMAPRPEPLTSAVELAAEDELLYERDEVVQEVLFDDLTMPRRYEGATHR
jgi:hypothetical protein